VSFVDTFGAPRMTGTKYQHKHEGTDIFAPIGTKLLATTRGVIERKGVAVLGGNKLWLHGEDGTQYYYAHLSAFVEGVDDGTVVEAGQVIGYVGITGNAVGTPSHLHFEIHPGGGGAINPFPTLDAVRKSDYNTFNNEAEKLRQQLLADANNGIAAGTAQGVSAVRAGIGVTREFAIGAIDQAVAPSITAVKPAPKVTTAITKAPATTLTQATTSAAPPPP
jgi:Peptidase family M23